MKEEDEELGSTSTYSDDDTQRIVLHVYDDESREFALLTTYHGMIRIYSSETWPSRIFWSLVVVTCLTLFMIHERKDLLAIFDSVLLGDSYGSREIEKLELLEQIYMNATKSNLSELEEYYQVRWDEEQQAYGCIQIHLKAGDWGDCVIGPFPGGGYVGGRYDRESCEVQCSVEHYMQQCGCIPFFAEEQDGRECTLAEMAKCRRKGMSLHERRGGCRCPADCERIDYTFSPVSYVKKSHKNRSSIEIQLQSRHLKVNEQLKRIKAVDLLSYVAGSMGLFLGMSCVTLLEIFIYLFKSVWGVFNDQRHKTYYLENLLGMNDEGSSTDSHEEIVITTKTGGNLAPVQNTEQSSLKSIAEEESIEFKENAHRRSRVKVSI
ncbi:Amiloride-sensitive sodium channel [Ancylostoma duodenale]|uniref:Amiloride-sensitive sodium channel n=1 Tax=Ancylostoma duodenale TaxID=51022 RepID=A0A0C2H0F3_9BILA|nr:Amiloride-sensitive sodium channel [Ancylostoma duodenale]